MIAKPNPTNPRTGLVNALQNSFGKPLGTLGVNPNPPNVHTFTNQVPNIHKAGKTKTQNHCVVEAINVEAITLGCCSVG